MRQRKQNTESHTGMNRLWNGVKFISALVILLLLSGCGKTATTTLVICDYHNKNEETTFLYDMNGKYYSLKDSDDIIYQIPDIGFTQNPILVLPEFDYDWTLTKVTTSLYYGNLYDVKGYVNALQNISYEYDKASATPALLEIYLKSETGSVRIIYMPDEYVRIYAINENGLACYPPLLSEE